MRDGRWTAAQVMAALDFDPSTWRRYRDGSREMPPDFAPCVAAVFRAHAARLTALAAQLGSGG